MAPKTLPDLTRVEMAILGHASYSRSGTAWTSSARSGTKGSRSASRSLPRP